MTSKEESVIAVPSSDMGGKEERKSIIINSPINNETNMTSRK
jgi:hypothetical protein